MTVTVSKTKDKSSVEQEREGSIKSNFFIKKKKSDLKKLILDAEAYEVEISQREQCDNEQKPYEDIFHPEVKSFLKAEFRLMTKKEFKTLTNAGFYKKRGKTLTKIDDLLGEYERYKDNPNVHNEEILQELSDVINKYEEKHRSDKNNPREAGIKLLKRTLTKERNYINEISKKEDRVNVISQEHFKDITFISKFGSEFLGINSRGKTLKTIDDYLQIYERILPISNNYDKKRAEHALNELLKNCKKYEERHKEDSSRVQRLANIRSMMSDINKELARLEKLELPKEKDEETTVEEGNEKSDAPKRVKGLFPSVLYKIMGSKKNKLKNVDDRVSMHSWYDIPVFGPGLGPTLGYEFRYEMSKPEENKCDLVLEARVNAGYGLSTGFFNASVKAGLGIYIEASAANFDNLIEEVSYGIYRKYRETSVIPRELTNSLFGGATSVAGYDMAEGWAAHVEQDVFDENNDAKIDIGGLVGAGAGANFTTNIYDMIPGGELINKTTPKAKGKASAGGALRAAKRYNKNSIQKKKFADQNLDEVSSSDVGYKRGAQKTLGSNVLSGVYAIDINANFWKGKIKFQGRLSATASIIKPSDFAFEFDGIRIQLDGLIGATIPNGPRESLQAVKEMANAIVKSLEKTYNGAKNLWSKTVDFFKEKEIRLDGLGEDKIIEELKGENIDKSQIEKELIQEMNADGIAQSSKSTSEREHFLAQYKELRTVAVIDVDSNGRKADLRIISLKGSTPRRILHRKNEFKVRTD